MPGGPWRSLEAGSHLKPYGSIVKVRFLRQNKGKTACFTTHPAVEPPVLLILRGRTDRSAKYPAVEATVLQNKCKTACFYFSPCGKTARFTTHLAVEAPVLPHTPR